MRWGGLFFFLRGFPITILLSQRKMHAFLKGGSLPQKEKSAAKEKPGSCEAKRSRAVPWVEKYRPRCVDEVAHQEEVVAVLKKSLQGADLPNLLFYGPPGTGKTSAILAAARDLFGPELYAQRVLELNASDERGIQVVRHKVKNFAQLTASSTRKDGSPCPPFKIVVLDEADSMTSAAQAALRRTMERETKTTRFCLICNYVSRIIEPLTSRCSKFRFKPLSDAAQEQRVRHVCDQEGLKIEQEALTELVKVAEGDLRRAITMLQSAARLVVGATITRAIIMEISASVPTAMLNALVEACRSSSIDKMDLAVQNICCEGYAATTLIGQLHEVVLCRADLSDRQKSAIADKLGEVDKCLVDGADEYLQMLALCSVLMTQFNRPAE